MNETNKLKEKLITLKGYTTSQINQALKADNPYPARVFLKVDNQEQDIPIFFRIKERKDCQFHSNCSADCRYKKGDWIRPKIKTGSLIEVWGYFDNPINGSSRKSFTASSYKLISCPHNQKKPYHCPIDCPCEKGQQLKTLQETKTQFPYLQNQVEKISQRVKDLSHEQ